VLERERPVVPGLGREKESLELAQDSETRPNCRKKNIPNEASSSPSAMRQLSSRLWRSSNPFLAWIILSPPNLVEVTDAMDGLEMTIDLAGETPSSSAGLNFYNGLNRLRLGQNSCLRHGRALLLTTSLLDSCARGLLHQ
jgi:hypothetical protein